MNFYEIKNDRKIYLVFDIAGLAHLEGLEMVSNQCEGKVQSLLGSMPPDDVSQIKPDLINIKDEFDLDQHEDDEAGWFLKIMCELFSNLIIFLRQVYF